MPGKSLWGLGGAKKGDEPREKGARDGGDRLNPNGFHSDALCRILAAACGSTPARASGTLFEARQSEITFSICIRSNYTPEPLSIGLLLRCISFLRL